MRSSIIEERFETGVVRSTTGGLDGVVSLDWIPSLRESSSIVALLSSSTLPMLRLRPPSRSSLLGLLLLDNFPFAFPLTLERNGLLRDVSKHSVQHGRPYRSTLARSAIFLKQPSQTKHFECHSLPLFSTNPPSERSITTGFLHAAHSPLTPGPTPSPSLAPAPIKHGRQSMRERSVGSG